MTAAATALGVSRPTLSSLLNGKAGLSGDMALRIGKGLWSEDGHADEDAILVGRHPPFRQRRNKSVCDESISSPTLDHNPDGKSHSARYISPPQASSY